MTISVGFGMILSLLLTETIGITAGGIIVPGYIGFYLHEPLNVILTFTISILTILILNILSNFVFIYGKRRLVLCILFGFLGGAFVESFYGIKFFNSLFSNFLETSSLGVIGYLIPGLIASWMDRQGVAKTISVVLITSSTVNLFVLWYLIIFDIYV